MSTPRIADQLGRVLGGRYRLVAPIGTGASAHVYLADDVRLHRRVAVKVLHPALADDDAFLRRFRAEAQAVAALRHPNIMNVYDHGEDDDGPFLVLEYLGGGSLRDMLDRGNLLSPSQTLMVGLEAARGLDYAHRRGLVHRDIKPANLLFDEEGRVAIADFGLARALAEAAWTEPAGAVLGTARYASPEQARGGSVDGKADVYALALLMVEAVTGQVPFAADTTIATLMARLDRELEVPEALGPLGPVLKRAAAPDPADRLDAAGLAKALDATASELPRPERLPIAGPPVVDLTRPADDLTVLPPTKSARLFDVEAAGLPDDGAPVARRRRRWPYFLLTGILVPVLVAGVAWAVVQAATPTHPVPALVGKTVAQARALAGNEHFGLHRIDDFDEDTPAGQVMSQQPAPRATLKEHRAVTVHVSKGPQPRFVPDLTGKNRADAQAAVESVGFKFVPQDRYDEQVPKDTVLEWSPNDKARHPRGSDVTVVFSKGPEPKAIPAFTGQLFDDWVKGVQAIWKNINRQDDFSDTVPKGQIISTDPSPGSLANIDAVITVHVSKGPDLVTVPDLKGMSEDQAVQTLQQAGLQPGARYGPPRKPVFAQNPPAGKQVPRNSQVDYYTG